MPENNGWKPIPLGLKILFVIFVFWIVGSFFSLPQRYEMGFPFFGIFISGILAALIVLVLDILGPLGFLMGLWKRKAWAPAVAYSYQGIFILNSLVALGTFREQLGIVPIVVPAVVSVVFLIVIFCHRGYFKG